MQMNARDVVLLIARLVWRTRVLWWWWWWWLLLMGMRCRHTLCGMVVVGCRQPRNHRRLGRDAAPSRAA